MKLLGFVVTVFNFSRWLKASLEVSFLTHCSFEPTGVFGVVCFALLLAKDFFCVTVGWGVQMYALLGKSEDNVHHTTQTLTTPGVQA